MLKVRSPMATRLLRVGRIGELSLAGEYLAAAKLAGKRRLLYACDMRLSAHISFRYTADWPPMLTRLNEADAPLPMCPVLLCGAVYAPFGVPGGGQYVVEVTAAAYVYVLAVYLGSTIWFARRQGGPGRRQTVRFAAAAAVAGALEATVVRLAADVFGLEYMYPNPDGMSFRILECYACEAPWDAATRAIWFHVRLVLLAVVLAPLLSALVDRRREGVPTPVV